MIKVVFTMKLPHLLFICISFLCSVPLYGLDGWMTDIQKAQLQAVEQHKDLFIVYKGSSWNPEQYGTAESMFACKAVQERLKKHFILLIQDYPPEYLGDLSLSFANKEKIDPSLEFPADWNWKRQNATRCVFATAGNIPYHVMKQDDSWSAFKIAQEEAGAKRKKVLHLVNMVQATHGEEKYRLMGKLFNLTAWFPGIPASQYFRMYKEATLYDLNNLSHIRNNYVKQMMETVWNLLWSQQALQYISSLEIKEIPQNVYSNLPVEQAQYMRFFKLVLTQVSLLETTESVTLDQFLNENYRKTCLILAEAPSTTAARIIRLQREKIFSQLYHCYKLFPLASQPELILKKLPDLLKKPWADEESKQLFQLMAAGCHLKIGELDKGLELMKKARDIAPWTGNATNADASIHTITGNLPALRELWKKKQDGDEKAAKTYEENTLIVISPFTLTIES